VPPESAWIGDAGISDAGISDAGPKAGVLRDSSVVPPG
jgi:hypothetical protein